MAETPSPCSSRRSSNYTDKDKLFTDRSRDSTELTSRQGSTSNSNDLKGEEQSIGITLPRCDSPGVYTPSVLEELGQPTSTPLPLHEYSVDTKSRDGIAVKRRLLEAENRDPEQASDAKKPRKVRNVNTASLMKLLKDILNPKKEVLRAANHYYFGLLSTPIPVPLELSKAYPASLKLHYSVPRDFILIQSLDGAGGTISKMYLAVHHPYQPNDFKQFVVLKGFPKEPGPIKLDSTTSRSALRQELRVYKRLAKVDESARRFIINAEGCVESSAFYYLVFPFLRCDLLDVLSAKNIDHRAYSRPWIAQLASGLECLHAQGIIHRNLKPANVLVDWDGSLKITDFTRAYVEGLDSAIPQPLQSGMKYAYRPRGTLEYMAPEVRAMVDFRQVIKEYGKFDPDETVSGLKGYGKEADVWSLGCISAEILRFDDHYKVLFNHEVDYQWFVTCDKGDQFEFIENFHIHGHIALDFVHGLLHPIPSARMKIAEIKNHPFYRHCAKSFDDLLKIRLPKKERLEYALQQDLSAEPAVGCLIKTVAMVPERDTPSLNSLEDYTWVNQNGRST